MNKSNSDFAAKWILSLIFLLNSIFFPIASMAQGPQCSAVFSQPTSLARASEGLYVQNLEIIKDFSNRISEFEQNPQAHLNDPQFNQLLKKYIFNPKEKLTVEEFQILNKNKFHKEVFEGLIRILALGEASGKALQQALLFWSGRLSTATIQHEKSFAKKALRSLQAAYNGPIRFMIPFLPLPKWNNPVDQILEKKYLNPKYEVTASEIEILKKYRAYNTFQDNVNFQKAQPKWSTFRRWVSRLFVAGIALNGAFVANWGLHLAEPGALVSSKVFLSETNYRLKDNQVRVYNESVPFPHMAIEIDGKVYSYGQTHLSIKTSQEYLLSEKITEAVQTQQMGQQKQNLQGTQSFYLQTLFNKTGLDKLPRSVQMVTLNLDASQKSQLKKYLERSDFSAYRNQTLIMDCASMITLALKKTTEVPIPELPNTPLTLDASPSGMMMYFGWLKTLNLKNQQGQSLVAEIKQVAMDRSEDTHLHLYRNLYINALEGRIFLSFLPINAIGRTYMNLRYGEDQFQYLEPEIQKEILSWKNDITHETLNSDINNPLGNQIAIFTEEARLLGEVPKSQRQANWEIKAQQIKTASQYFLNKEINESKAKLDSADSAFSDLIRAGYRFQLLLQTQDHIHSLLQNPNHQLQPLTEKQAEEILNSVLKKTR